MDSRTVSWDTKDDVIEIIDQTLLPGEVRIIRCDTAERLALAIQRLEVRGAPALGVAGAYGIRLKIFSKQSMRVRISSNQQGRQRSTLHGV